MGFFQSAKNQVGRDLGKVVSNFVFGDKHASVYRRAQSKSQAKLAETKAKEREQVIEQRHQEDIYRLDRAVIGNVDKVLATRIPANPNDICNLMDLMHSQVEINGWKAVLLSDDADKNRVYNKYTEACYNKFCQCIQRLQLNGASPEVVAHYNKIKKKLRLKKLWGINRIALSFAAFFAAILIICGILAIIEG